MKVTTLHENNHVYIPTKNRLVKTLTSNLVNEKSLSATFLYTNFFVRQALRAEMNLEG